MTLTISEPSLEQMAFTGEVGGGLDRDFLLVGGWMCGAFGLLGCWSALLALKGQWGGCILWVGGWVNFAWVSGKRLFLGQIVNWLFLGQVVPILGIPTGWWWLGGVGFGWVAGLRCLSGRFGGRLRGIPANLDGFLLLVWTWEWVGRPMLLRFLRPSEWRPGEGPSFEATWWPRCRFR